MSDYNSSDVRNAQVPQLGHLAGYGVQMSPLAHVGIENAPAFSQVLLQPYWTNVLI